MNRERKIRELVESHDGDQIVLDDVIRKLVEASGYARNLEYASKKTDLRKTKKVVREASDLLKAFNKRLREDITTSVNSIALEKNINYKGNPDALPK